MSLTNQHQNASGQVSLDIGPDSPFSKEILRASGLGWFGADENRFYIVDKTGETILLIDFDPATGTPVHLSSHRKKEDILDLLESLAGGNDSLQEVRSWLYSALNVAPSIISQDLLWDYIIDPKKGFGSVAMIALSDNGETATMYAPNPYANSKGRSENGEYAEAHPVELGDTYSANILYQDKLIPHRGPAELAKLDTVFLTNPVSVISLPELYANSKNHVYLADPESGMARKIDKDGYIMVAFDQGRFVTAGISTGAFQTCFDYSSRVHNDPDLFNNYLADLDRLMAGELDPKLNESIVSKGKRIQSISNGLKSRYLGMFDVPETMVTVAQLDELVLHLERWPAAQSERLAASREHNQKHGESQMPEDLWLRLRTDLTLNHEISILLKLTAILYGNLSPLRTGSVKSDGSLSTIRQTKPLSELIAWTERLYGTPYDPEEIYTSTHRGSINHRISTTMIECHDKAMKEMLKAGTYDEKTGVARARQLFLEKEPNGLPEALMKKHFSHEEASQHYGFDRLSTFIRNAALTTFKDGKLKRADDDLFLAIDEDAANRIIAIWAEHRFSDKERAAGRDEYFEHKMWEEFLDEHCHTNDVARRALATHYNIPYIPYQSSQQKNDDWARNVSRRLVDAAIQALNPGKNI